MILFLCMQIKTLYVTSKGQFIKFTKDTKVTVIQLDIILSEP